jgi:hypothetical protein
MRSPARCPARELRDGGQQQETAEDAGESPRTKSGVEKSARQRTRCTEQPEPYKDRAIHVGAQSPAADGGRRGVRQRHKCDGGCSAESDGEQWCHQAANAKPDHRGGRAGENCHDEHRDQKHRAILSPTGDCGSSQIGNALSGV